MGNCCPVGPPTIDTHKNNGDIPANFSWHRFSLGSRLFLGSLSASLFYTWLPGLGILGVFLYRVTYLFLWSYIQFALALMQVTGFDTVEMRRIAPGGPMLLIILKGKYFAFYYIISLLLLSYGVGYVVTTIRSRLSKYAAS